MLGNDPRPSSLDEAILSVELSTGLGLNLILKLPRLKLGKYQQEKKYLSEKKNDTKDTVSVLRGI